MRINANPIPNSICQKQVPQFHLPRNQPSLRDVKNRRAALLTYVCHQQRIANSEARELSRDGYGGLRIFSQPRERRKFEPVYRWSGRQVRLWVLVWLRSLYSLTLFRQAKSMLSETRGSITIFVIDCAYLRAHGDCRSVQSGDAAEHDGKTYYFRGNAF